MQSPQFSGENGMSDKRSSLINRMAYRAWKWWPSIRYAYRPKKPILFLRLVKGLFHARILRQVKLRYVDMALDFACNMHCEHCFATALVPEDKKKAHRMTTHDYRRVAKEAMALGALNFSFQGGEPILIKNLSEYIASVSPRRNVISVTTNGSLLTAEKIHNLKKQGVDILTISVDSAIPEEHDKFRDYPGAFDMAMKAIHEAVSQGLHVTIGTTISHDNLHSKGISDLVKYAEENKIILCFAFATPIGNWAHHDNKLLTEDDVAWVREMEKKSMYIRTDFEGNLYSSGCGAVKEILYITPYGDVLPCPFIHISLGNVMKEPLGAIRKRALRVAEFAHYAPKCLCAEDRDFIQKYIKPACSKGLADGFETFGWERPKPYM